MQKIIKLTVLIFVITFLYCTSQYYSRNWKVKKYNYKSKSELQEDMNFLNTLVGNEIYKDINALKNVKPNEYWDFDDTTKNKYPNPFSPPIDRKMDIKNFDSVLVFIVDSLGYIHRKCFLVNEDKRKPDRIYAHSLTQYIDSYNNYICYFIQDNEIIDKLLLLKFRNYYILTDINFFKSS